MSNQRQRYQIIGYNKDSRVRPVHCCTATNRTEAWEKAVIIGGRFKDDFCEVGFCTKQSKRFRSAINQGMRMDESLNVQVDIEKEGKRWGIR